MRIAVYHNLPSGGAKRTLMEVTRKLALRHDVDVYTLSCAEHDFADLRPWASAHHVVEFRPLPLLASPLGRVNQATRCADLSRLGRLTRRLARRIDEEAYDIAFVHPCRYEQSPSLLRHLRRTRSVYFCQEPPRVLYEAMPARPYDADVLGHRRILDRLDPLPSLYRQQLRSVDRANTRSAGTVLVSSRFMAQTVRRVYDVDARINPLGVDADCFRPLGIPRRDVVLSVGSLTPLKAFDFLVRAMAQYRGRIRPTLVVASNFQNPPERAYLEQLARDLRVDVAFVGNVSDQDLVRLYNEARLVVYAPVREPFGLVPLEAMACGTPVVAVAEGGVPESVIDGRTGILTDRDPAAFAGAVQQLMEDPTRARRFGENGRDQILARWTWDHVVTSLERHLVDDRDDQEPVRQPISVPASPTSARLG